MSDYATLKNELIEKAEGLARRVQAVESHLRGLDREAPGDWSDRAQFLENDQVLEALDDQDRATLQQIKSALSRIDAGTYGACASCGETIPAARLHAVPFATTCVSCAA